MSRLYSASSICRPWICPSCRHASREVPIRGSAAQTRRLQTSSPTAVDPIPFRKQLKEEAKRRRQNGPLGTLSNAIDTRSRLGAWELTVGIEVHAQLNTERKLFSRAATSIDSEPNANTALFDLALPGSQPEFQIPTLLPALRAALALNCNVQRKSTFDRKHYFYPDQPAGYQITQYYFPFAKDGHITLNKDDGIAIEEEDEVRIGIKQIQMEQDTAKTVQQPPDGSLLDFNRVGHPLIEVITLPHIHHPKTAAACVRKIQQVLQAVSAVTTGMELGGLRADVNVSVRRRDAEDGLHSYYGVGGLGQRTEIKNLSSTKAVEDAIIAERDRQIDVLESGGTIEGETRGWTIGSTETRRLRGKEGEVDYRYMPDPDLPPLIIGKDLIEHLSASLPMLPDEQTRVLVKDYGLTMKDAKTLVLLDGGLRLDYFQDVVSASRNTETSDQDLAALGKKIGNWVIHELGGMFSATETEFTVDRVWPESLASIIENLSSGVITGKTAKQLLATVFRGDSRKVQDIIFEEKLQIQRLSDEEYCQMAIAIVEDNTEMAEKVRQGQKGKLQWFVGQMIRRGEGKVDAQRATRALRPILGLE